MVIFNEWLIFSLIIFVIWIIIFILIRSKKEMLIVSALTMPFGLTEPLFVPEYWSPPSLFNLAVSTGFDIESLIFSFAVGGIGSVFYESIFKSKHKKMNSKEKHHKSHEYHLLSLFFPIIVFLPLFLFTELNPIYSICLAMLVGGIIGMFCRPDLKKKIAYGGIMFSVLYFLFFILFNSIYPYAIEKFWNLSVLSGILLLGIPLEELIFAFTFGMMWSSIYEHIMWYKLLTKK